MRQMVNNKIDIANYIKELEEKIKNHNITEQDIENHLLTIKYLKRIRNIRLLNAFECFFFSFILYNILYLKGWFLLIILFAIFIIIFSLLSEFNYYRKNVNYFYELNDKINNIVKNSVK